MEPTGKTWVAEAQPLPTVTLNDKPYTVVPAGRPPVAASTGLLSAPVPDVCRGLIYASFRLDERSAGRAVNRFFIRVRQVGPGSWLWTVATPDVEGDPYTVPGLRLGMSGRRVDAVNEARGWIYWLHAGPPTPEITVIDY